MAGDLLDLEYLRRLFFIKKGFLVYNMVQLLVIISLVIYVRTEGGF